MRLTDQEQFDGLLHRAHLQQQVVSHVSSSQFVRQGDILGLSRYITEEVGELLGIERVCVWLFNDAKDELICQDIYFKSQQVHACGAVLRKCEFEDEFSYLLTEKYVDASDPYTDPRTRGFIEGYLKPNGITAMLDGVVRIGEELVGTVCFEHVGQAHQWREDELVFVSQLGDQVALTVSIQRSNAVEQKLREREIQLRDLNAQLEQRVFERTREIKEALELLQRTQSELLQREKLASLGNLVAGIAHELNTPIGNSLMIASTFQEKAHEFSIDLASGISRKKLQDLIDTTQNGGELLVNSLQRAADLVASFKQVAVDQASLNRRRFGLHATANEIVMILGPTIRKTRHTIENHIPADITLESYPGPLGQILTNLVNNALVHAFDGVDTGVIRFDGYVLGDGLVQLTVTDNGVGIPEENLPRIFDPFFTTRLGQGGSGLGLNIVYNLAQSALDGKIEVQSTPGQGTRFILTLPMVAGLSPAA